MLAQPSMQRMLDVSMLVVAGLLSFFVFAPAPARAMSGAIQGEFRNHSLLLARLETEGTSPYSLWYVLQQAIVGGNRDEQVLLSAGWLLLGALAVVKGIVLSGVLFAHGASRIQALVVGFLLGTAVALPIPFLDRFSRLEGGHANYLGTLPPNVFMSATQLIANTAAVAAIVTLTIWYQKPTNARWVVMVVMALIATLAKPGITPALMATIVLLAMLLIRAQREQWLPILVRAAIALFVIGVPLLVAYLDFMSSKGWLGVHSEVRPFDTWTAFTDQWFPDLIASWAFPLTVVAVLFAIRRSSPLGREWLLPAWLVTVIATLMFALLSEVKANGEVQYSGNFAWGAYAATSALYVVSAIALHGVPWKVRWVPYGVLAIQAIAGLHYINVYITTGRFI